MSCETERVCTATSGIGVDSQAANKSDSISNRPALRGAHRPLGRSAGTAVFRGAVALSKWTLSATIAAKLKILHAEK